MFIMQKYFIGIKLNGSLLSLTKVLQGNLVQLGGYDLGKKFEPHVTIVAPFEIIDRYPSSSASILNDLIFNLEAFAGELRPFRLNMMGVGHFVDQVIYIDPEPSLGITEIYFGITSERFHQKDSQFSHVPPHRSAFVPHITLWRKEDQSPENHWCGFSSFRQLYDSLAEFTPQADQVFSEVTSFTLFSKENGTRWKEVCTFTLG